MQKYADYCRVYAVKLAIYTNYFEEKDHFPFKGRLPWF